MSVELAEVRAFLAEHPPFNELSPAALDALPAQLTARYFRRGTTLVTLGTRNDTMFIVRSGAVDITDAHGALVEKADEGRCFGMSSVLSGGASQFTMIAAEDTLALLMPAAVFHQLLKSEPAFTTFFLAQQAGRLRSAVQTVAVDDAGAAVLRTPVEEIATRAPITVPPTASIRAAAQVMSDERVSALLVTDPTSGRLAGIVTDRDLRRVVAEARDADAPVSTLMTADPSTVAPDALAFEVLTGMTLRRIHHLPVVRDGVPVGMVTAGDLMRLEQSNPVFLVDDLARQADLPGLQAAAGRLPKVVDALAGQNVPADDIARVVTSTADALTRRLLNLAEEKLGPAPVRYCWVALGSQARSELTPGSDQDSALVLADEAGPEHDAYFAALSAFVTEGLADCGFPLCPGDMMASNPQWRKPVRAWASEFARWINSPDPDALLHTQTFFDLRPVYGDSALADRLTAGIATAAPRSSRFLQQLATQAQAWKTPIGFFRDFVLAEEGEHRNTLDLKAGGITAVVQMARLFALSRGVTVTSTAGRLRAAAAAGALSAANAENLVDAFAFLQQVRLANQVAQTRQGRRPDNHVDPSTLTALDKRHLKDAFEAIRRMQGALGHVYSTRLTS